MGNYNLHYLELRACQHTWKGTSNYNLLSSCCGDDSSCILHVKVCAEFDETIIVFTSQIVQFFPSPLLLSHQNSLFQILIKQREKKNYQAITITTRYSAVQGKFTIL